MAFLAAACNNSSSDFEDISAPAIYYGVVSQDSVLYSHKEGNLSVASDQPINAHSQFALFSITKTFTAIGVMQLVQSGKIGLDDRAIKYLPQYTFLGEITIRQLLAHQSGINNPLPIRWIHLAEEDDAFDFEKFNRDILTQKAKVKSEAGTKASYSNLNFVLLGEIISQVASQSYQSYVQENVLNSEEIGFQWKDENTVTGYHSGGFQGLVLGFLMDKKKYTHPKVNGLIPFKKLNLNGSAHGGLLSSANGLNVFLQELLRADSQILSQDMKQAMYEEQSLSNGKPSGHSLGWFTGNVNGERYVHHPGGGGGYYLEMRIYPEKGIATYLLTNKSGFSDQRILDELDTQYVQFN